MDNRVAIVVGLTAALSCSVGLNAILLQKPETLNILAALCNPPQAADTYDSGNKSQDSAKDLSSVKSASPAGPTGSTSRKTPNNASLAPHTTCYWHSPECITDPSAAGCNCCPGTLGCYFWNYGDTVDCVDVVPVQTCGTNLKDCEDFCIGDPACGGFTLPDGHVKQAGCALNLIAPSIPAQTLHIRNKLPERREYLWQYKEKDCLITTSGEYSLGPCQIAMGNVTMLSEDQVGACVADCRDNDYCAGFTSLGLLKPMNCEEDMASSGPGGQHLYLFHEYPQPRSNLILDANAFESHSGPGGWDCPHGSELLECDMSVTPAPEEACQAKCLENPYCGGVSWPTDSVSNVGSVGYMKTMECSKLWALNQNPGYNFKKVVHVSPPS